MRCAGPSSELTKKENDQALERDRACHQDRGRGGHACRRGAAMVRFKRLTCSQEHGSRALLLPGRRARRIAGSVRPTSDVTARKPRYCWRFSQSMLWRDVMCQKTSGNLGFSVPGVRKNRRSARGRVPLARERYPLRSTISGALGKVHRMPAIGPESVPRDLAVGG